MYDCSSNEGSSYKCCLFLLGNSIQKCYERIASKYKRSLLRSFIGFIHLFPLLVPTSWLLDFLVRSSFVFTNQLLKSYVSHPDEPVSIYEHIYSLIKYCFYRLRFCKSNISIRIPDFFTYYATYSCLK